MMTRICADDGFTGTRGGVWRGNKLIPEPGGVTDNPREEL